MKTYIIFIGVLILTVSLKINIWGCTCSGYPSVCGAYSSAEAVFVGTVVKVQEVENLRKQKVTRVSDGKEEDLNISGWKHYIKVEKAFKGNLQNEIILATEDNSCSGKYEVGAKLLLYAYFNKDLEMWEINSCGRNTSFENAKDDLLFLNGLPKTANRTRISGDFSRYEDTPESGFTRTQNLAGAKIKISSRKKTYEILTDQDGVYEIYDLPEDIYTITPEIPKNLKIRFPIYYGFGGFLENILNESNSVRINLKDNRCVGVDFLYNTNNKISGKVFDAKGTPMKNVCLDLIPLVENKSSYFRVFDCTEEDGSFVLDDMPAGKYLILANNDGKISSNEPFPQLYYPNTFDKEKATVITMSEGDFRENYDITVPSQSETITVTGTLLYSDGKPVADEFVEFQSDKKQIGIDDKTNTKTNSRGQFTLKTLKGLKGKIYGGMFTYEGEFERCSVLDRFIREKKKGIGNFTVETTPQEIIADENFENIILKFPFPKCVKTKQEN